jgi:cytochrome P450
MQAQIRGPRRPGLVQTVEYAFRPHAFVTRNVARYGPVFRMKGAAGELLLTASPDHARKVFAADPDTLGTLGTASLKGILGARSVLVTDGPVHRRQRKLLTPPLHGPRLRAFGAAMQAIAREHVDRLRVGERFLAHTLTTEFTLDVILRTVFGVESGSEASALRTVLLSMLEGFSPLAIFAPVFQSPLFPPHRRFLSARARFDHAIEHLIRARRRQSSERSDVLSLFLDARYEDGATMDEEEIRDQLLTLLLAGHETTAITLAWVLDFVLRRPALIERLQREIAGVDDPEAIAKLPLLSAVLDETMRIAPVVTDVARIPKVPFALEPDLVVPVGRPLVVLIEGIHRDPSIYPDPDTFLPERFLERRFGPTEFLPFGGGSRRCLGAAFSEYEGRIFLATLLSRLSLRTTRPSSSRRVRRNITMGPDDGVPLEVTARR